MLVATSSIRLETRGFSDVHDITAEVQAAVKEAGLSEGTVTVFVPGSTAGLTTIEFESGAVSDLKEAIERMAPRDIPYRHDARWGDGNGFSHVRAALLGPSLSIPAAGGKLVLGTWQQIVLVDFDNRPRSRELLVQSLGR